MAKVYITRCIVKKDGKQHARGSVMEGLTDDEIKQGLAQHWLEAVGHSDEPTSAKDSKKAFKREKLLAKAKELNINVSDAMTDEDIQQLIEKAQG